MRTILVLGLSGVGKSSLIRRAAETRIVLYLTASDLIKTGLARRAEQATSEELRKGAVLDNQQVLSEEFRLAVSRTDRELVIFDGHNVIDTPTRLLEIPSGVLSQLGPDVVIFVEDDPTHIAARRAADTARIRPPRTPQELALHQALAKSNAQMLAANLAAPFHAVRSGDIDALLAALC
jgi:adenylate kinase